MANDNISVSGTVDTIIYHSEESGYTVCMLDCGGECVTVVGTLPYITEGDRITAHGEFVTHPVHGRQFRCDYFERIMPETSSDILRYLSSGAIKGIGPKTAARIVEKFGEDTFEVIETHPDWLTQINGISPKRAATISQSFAKMSGVRNVIMFCRNLCSAESAMRIYKKWGASSVERIREDPYRLCRDFSGIGFARADEIALALGAAPDDERRLEAGTCHALDSLIRSTSATLISADELCAAVMSLLGADRQCAQSAVVRAVESGRIVRSEQGGITYFTTAQIDRAERFAAAKLHLVNDRCPAVPANDTAALIAKCENEAGVEYAPLQKEAIYSALSAGVSIITGGPGTGKTTVVRALISIFASIGLRSALAAPTGRAAKRMSEATGQDSATIHRLLEMEYSGDEENARFLRDDTNLLSEDAFIIDEASMIDVFLLEAFMRAVKPGARIVFIGDSDQLPPVGAGNVLSDLIRSAAFGVVRLNQIFRQSSESAIVTNAHRIKCGEMPDVSHSDGDFFFLRRENDAQSAETVLELVTNRLPRAYGREFAENVQVITPSRRGSCGTEELNRALQAMLNTPAPHKAQRAFGEKIIRVGDRVMQTKNNYELEWERWGMEGRGIFNGDIGTVLAIDAQEEKMKISFDERECDYAFENVQDLEHAYAITVHKSQGSEYGAVIVPLYHCAPMLLTRNLLYTAVTRAAKMVILVGSAHVLQRMVETENRTERRTALAQRIAEG